MTDHHEAFLAAIADNPADPTLRLVYADWLEEQGDLACEIIRWAHAEGKRPMDCTWAEFEMPFAWYPNYGGIMSVLDPESDIPVTIFNRMSRGKMHDVHGVRRRYDTVGEAWLDFCEAACKAAKEQSKPLPTS